MDREALNILKTSRQALFNPIYLCRFPHSARMSARITEAICTTSASARRLCPRLCIRFPSLCRAISTLLHFDSVADFSLSTDLAATAFTADLIRFAEPLSRRTSSLHCSAAESRNRRNPNLYGPYNLPYGPYSLSAGNHRSLPYTARTTFHMDRIASSDKAMDPNQERRTKHAHAKRPRSSPTSRPPQPPPQPAPEPCEYTDRANRFEERYLTIPTRRMYDNFISMQKKTVENTQRVDLETLRKLGVEQQFLHLTSRVGISLEF